MELIKAKREIGLNPMRSRHCNAELTIISTVEINGKEIVIQ